jgi:gliding motility-associated-like protein
MRKLILTILAIYLSKSLFAQSFYNKGAEMIITENTTFTVNDSLVNQGVITNNGNMVMGGVWFNTGTYNAGTGEITFNSPSSGDPQIINHSSQSFAKLTISGGGEKIMLADMTIDGELILKDGVIIQQNNSKVNFAATAFVTGASDASHINTPVTWQGTGIKVFPLGNGIRYLPVTLNGVEGNGTVVQVEAQENSAPLQSSNALASVFANRYWRVEALTGNLTGTTITLPIEGAAINQGEETRLVVAQSSSLQSDFSSIGAQSITGLPVLGFLTSAQFPSAQFLAIALASESGGEILVYNALSANDDGLNDFIRIENIEEYPDNKVSVFNRWGDMVFEQTNYDNTVNFFKGLNRGGEKLPTGIYFYKIEASGLSESKTGYISLK